MAKLGIEGKFQVRPSAKATYEVVGYEDEEFVTIVLPGHYNVRSINVVVPEDYPEDERLAIMPHTSITFQRRSTLQKKPQR